MDMETLESALTILFYMAAAGSLGFLLIRWVRLEYRLWKNQQAAVEVCAAIAYFKDPEVGYLPQGSASSSVHHITFHTDGGDIVTLYMGPRDYYAIEEGARGKLTWQGTRFWSFVPDNPEN